MIKTNPDIGRPLFALGMAGLGILGLIYGDFAINWQPIPAGLPAREIFAYFAAIVSLLAGIGLFFSRTAKSAAGVLLVYLALAWVLPQTAKVAASPGAVAAWLGVCEPLAVLCGCWILWASLAAPQADADSRAISLARKLFGITCLVFGLSHLVYATFTAAMIPPWIPLPLALAYLTGAGHIAAGVALTCSLYPRLAATLEALMMSSFVLLVHIPSLIVPPAWAPTPRMQWTGLLWATVLAGSAWIVAYSLRRTSWQRL